MDEHANLSLLVLKEYYIYLSLINAGGRNDHTPDPYNIIPDPYPINNQGNLTLFYPPINLDKIPCRPRMTLTSKAK